MAHKKKDMPVEAVGKYEPTTYLSWGSDSRIKVTGSIRKVKVGDDICVIIHGKVSGISERQYEDSKSESIDLKLRSIAIDPSDKEMKEVLDY